MKQIAALLIFVAISFSSTAQTDSSEIKKNTMYVEAFGSGVFGSIGYSRRIKDYKRGFNTIQGGITYAPKSLDFGAGSYLGGHVEDHFLLGKNNHYLDLGVGIGYLAIGKGLENRILNTFYLNPQIGYCYQRNKGGLFGKLNVQLLTGIWNLERFDFENRQISSSYFLGSAAGFDNPVFLWPSASIGYTF